ncbi:succinylglutamate desuccinylase/aspartoacylase family protein [Cohnella rhizosphaerae]|uniref:Succinylglutamate desuccinylase/aspartoacylase family protein n=1 Tax=Cohnella rhizosphaerae TaxID=1457232 RepID=A0A9X4KXZ9_9BACL|nr:succinylglutamate desuccinylase/aspartoacylase family protein [Cohnella rhizosphaerae]MDG0813381.1 succinylglutamate desuccinylase/aspartoacylase family protein [Cohnella rhizosphaerae]
MPSPRWRAIITIRTPRSAAAAALPPKRSAAPLLWGHERIAPGRSVSSAQSLEVPWLYTEAYGGRRIRPEDADLFYRGTLRLMNHLGMLVRPNPSELGPAPATIRTIHGDGNFDESVAAAADGFFIPDVTLLTELRTGDRIGTIRSYGGEVLDEVRASSEGVLVMLLGTPIVRKGGFDLFDRAYARMMFWVLFLLTNRL